MTLSAASPRTRDRLVRGTGEGTRGRGIAAVLVAAALVLAGCSGGSSPASPSSTLGGSTGPSGSAVPTGGTSTSGPATSASQTSATGATRTSGGSTTTGKGQTTKPPVQGPTVDPIQAKVTELEQSCGCASLVVTVKGSKITPKPKDYRVQIGQTLRLILLTDTAASVLGTGIGVTSLSGGAAPVKANDPTAFDLFTTDPGTYEVKLVTPGGARLLRVIVK